MRWFQSRVQDVAVDSSLLSCGSLVPLLIHSDAFEAWTLTLLASREKDHQQLLVGANSLDHDTPEPSMYIDFGEPEPQTVPPVRLGTA